MFVIYDEKDDTFKEYVCEKEQDTNSNYNECTADFYKGFYAGAVMMYKIVQKEKGN